MTGLPHASQWLTGLACLGVGVTLGAILTLTRRRRPAAPAGPQAGGRAAASDLLDLTDGAAVLLRSPEGVIRHWSAGCERLFGFTTAEALGQRVQELLATRFPAGGLRTAQEELFRIGEWRGELRHRRRNGEQVTVAAHWFLRRDARTGAPSAVVELQTDMTGFTAVEAAVNAGEARLLLAQEVAGVSTWEWDAEQNRFSWMPAQYGLPEDSQAEGAELSFEIFLGRIHPQDQEAVRKAARQALETGEYEAEFRILRPGRDGGQEIRWLIGRGRRMPGPAGRLGPVLGVHVDITARKEAEERQVLLMREVDHRAKNALAVVQAVLSLTRADTVEAYGRAINGRVTALARAQTLLAASHWVGADLAAMVQDELAPFQGTTRAARVTLEGPAVTVAPVAAQPLSMTLHELATNAVKYGSLSSAEGRLSVSWALDPPGGWLRLRWTETGGPAIDVPPQRRGFGSRMIHNTIQDQLRGKVGFEWASSGLVCTIEIPLSRSVVPLSRPALATRAPREAAV